MNSTELPKLAAPGSGLKSICKRKPKHTTRDAGVIRDQAQRGVASHILDREDKILWDHGAAGDGEVGIGNMQEGLLANLWAVCVDRTGTDVAAGSRARDPTTAILPAPRMPPHGVPARAGASEGAAF